MTTTPASPEDAAAVGHRMSKRLRALLDLLPTHMRSPDDAELLQRAQSLFPNPDTEAAPSPDDVVAFAYTASDGASVVDAARRSTDPATSLEAVAELDLAMDRDLVRAICETPGGAYALANNKGLSPEHEHYVLDRTTEWLEQMGMTDEHAESMYRGLHTLATSGVVPPGHKIHDVLTALCPPADFQNPVTEPFIKGPGALALRLLSVMPSATEQQLSQFARLSWVNEPEMSSLLCRGDVTPTVVVAALDNYQPEAGLAYVLAHTNLLAVPEVAEATRRAVDTLVLTGSTIRLAQRLQSLCHSSSDPANVRRHTKIFATYLPLEAAQWIEHQSPAFLDRLDADCLLPLLTASDGEARSVGTRLMASVRGAHRTTKRR